uniref:Uncharacterized protein n=1 Tax=Acetobacter pasteurianus TaxID=438 RepID=I3W087_ACEPA|nr:hypothetical protein [Acetobacter pasteurianus]AFK89014.1 hypothetical protein [Acetobacter pasteurianus]
MSNNITVKDGNNTLSLVIDGAKEIGFYFFEVVAFVVFAVMFCFFVAVI